MTVHPEISFNALVVSLATSAAVHFGDAADPASGQKQPANVDAAGHMVDLLAVLAEKTQGNLTPEESLFLTQVLSALRARYLEARQGGDGVAAATPGAPGRS
jgi:hypothetical protein